MKEDRNDLAYWFPRLAATGVPVPRTEIVTTDVALESLCDGIAPPNFGAFLLQLDTAAHRVGTPFFLRTGHTSGKHDWERTCYVPRPEDLANHVAALVEFSACADFIGLPTRTWAVREFLRLVHTFTAFRGMPVAVELRWFVRDGKSQCCHPYWPHDAIYGASDPDWRIRLEGIHNAYGSPKDMGEMHDVVSRVASAFDGGWSVDVARTMDGRWVVIDMAEADRSFHWPGCPNATEVAS